jgi:hypothetical protein
MGFSLSGTAPTCVDGHFGPPPPSRLSATPVTRRRIVRPGVSIRRWLARPRGPDTPHRVLHLSVPGIRPYTSPGYVFTVRPTKRCRPIRVALWGCAGLPELSGLLMVELLIP